MSDIFAHNTADEFFKEPRLVYIRKKEKPVSRRPKTPEEIKRRAEEQLARLKSQNLFDMEEEEKDSGSGPRTHTDTQRHTRQAYKPKPYYQETVDAVERAVEIAHRMEAKETQRMQGVHENLYEQYLNPGFMMYLRSRPGNLLGKVYPILDRIMKYPANFEYRSLPGGIVHIVKKEPKKDQPTEIGDNFLVVMEGGDGSISRVRDGTVDIPLKVDGKLPWVTNDSFRKNLPKYNEMWTTEHGRLLYDDDFLAFTAEARGKRTVRERQELWNKLYAESFKDIPAELKEIFVAMNVDFPRRFVGLINGRDLDWEKRNPHVQNILQEIQDQGRTYEEVTKEGQRKLKIWVRSDPNNPDVYAIYTSQYKYQPLRVNGKGQILRLQPDGSWSRDPRYTENVRRDYYYRMDNGGNTDLLTVDTKLTEPEKERMKRTEGLRNTPQVTDPPWYQRINDMNAFERERERVDKALFAERDINKLKAITLYVLPAQERNNPRVVSKIRGFRNTQGNRRKLQKITKYYLDEVDMPKIDRTRNIRVAAMLGVTP